MTNKENIKNSKWFVNIVAAQALCVVLIMLCLFIYKFWFKAEYEKIKNWYFKEIACDTNVDEVLK